MKKIFYLLFFLAVSNQLCAQIDNNFWFVAPEVSINHGDRPIYMRIATMSDTANIVLRMPASPSFTPITQKINPNTSFSIDLTPWIDSIEDKPSDQVLDRGLQLTSDKNITAYYEVANASNPAVSSMKGKNALGTEFYISGQTDYPNQANDGSETFDIVATEDNTHINITPRIAIIGHAAGITFQVVLNKGQTYCARTLDITAAASLAGSHVTSDKPIAITVFDDSIITGGWDEIADQTIPINLLGWDYIVIKGYADNLVGNNDEHVYILATINNTDIYLDGNPVPVVNLNAGNQYDYSIPPANNTVKIKASNPVYVYHLTGHSGEAGSAIIPQDSCTGSRQVGFTRTSTFDFAMLILTRNGNQGSFLLNGSNSIILASDFNVVPGTGNAWVYYRKNLLPVAQVPVGGNLLSNTAGKFHLGILNKISAGSSEYGYFSDFSSLYLGADQSMCPGDSITLDGGMDRTSYEWKKVVGGIWVIIDTNRFLVVHDSGYYAVMTNGDFCELRDTIHIGLYPAPSFTLGPDTMLCQGATITLDPGAFVSYRWQNGFTGRLFTTGSAGIYWVRVTGNNGCRAVDTIVISIDSLPRTAGNITGLSSVCQVQNGDSYSVPPFPFTDTYLWTIPSGSSGTSTTNSILLDYSSSAISDTLRVKGHNACGDSPELKLPVTVNPRPVPTIVGPAAVCLTTTQSYSTAAGMTGYTWSVTGAGNTISGGNTNTVLISWNTNGAQTVSVNYTDIHGCTASTPSVYPVTVTQLPSPTLNGLTNICKGIPVVYTTEAGMSAYVWTVSAGGLVTGGGTATDNTVTVTWNTSGSQSVGVNYTATGCTAAGPVVLMVTVKPNPVMSNVAASSVCSPGITGIILESNPTGSSFSWTATGSSPDVSGYSASSGLSIIQPLQNSGSATQTVTYCVTPVLNGCTGPPSDYVVSVFPVPDVSFAPNGQTLCSETSTGIKLNSGVSGAFFSWTASGSSPAISGYSPDNGLSISQTLVNSGYSTGSVTYLVTPVANSCTGLQKGVSVIVNPLPSVTFTLCNDPTTTTSAVPFRLKGGIPAGGTYSGAGVSAGTFNPSIAGTGAHILTYTYTNTWGCNATASHSFSVINPPAFICDDFFTDPRDNKQYSTIKIGTQCWLAENLDYGTTISSPQVQRDNCIPEKLCFANAAVNCTSSGGLYSWDEMMQYDEAATGQGICPPGWHVPDDTEWTSLFNFYLNNGFAASPLKYTGYSGFNALLNGAGFIASFWRFGTFATMIWSSTSDGPYKAWAHGMNNINPSVSYYPASRSNTFSVRCIKN